MSNNPQVYPVLCYKDARGAIDWLKSTLGYESLVEHADEGGWVYHAELRLEDAVVMLSGHPDGADPKNPWSTASFGTYTAVDDIDAHYERAVTAGADIAMEIHDTGYGSRDFTVRDAAGHLWSFGTYRPEL